MNTKSRIVLAGGSGFLGTRLAEELAARDHDVVVLTRSPRPGLPSRREVAWDGRSEGAWARELDGAAAVINLTGRSVNCRYTAANRSEIVASRVDSVRAVGAAIARAQRPPPVWIQAGSSAIYGNAGDRWCAEDSPPGGGFPVETCLKWEEAFGEMATPGTRQVLLRIGFALDRGRGALGTLEGLVRWYLGGTVGGGNQFMSWIHWRDLNSLFLAGLDRSELSGVFNAVGPNPVTNAEFMRELRRALGRPWSPPAPAWAVHLGCWLMRTEPSLALKGWRATPRNFLKAGIRFRFPELRGALDEIYGGK